MGRRDCQPLSPKSKILAPLCKGSLGRCKRRKIFHSLKKLRTDGSQLFHIEYQSSSWPTSR